MRVATWNVNSIRARMPHLLDWLGKAHPDVVCLQETKVDDPLFPEETIGDAGYRTVFTGQKTYNGVAVLARTQLAIEDVKKSLDGDADDAQRRFLACTVEGVRIVNVYVPNGQSVGTPAFAYKLAWLERLRRELDEHAKAEGDVLLCGDFNIAPEPIDVHDPKRWEGKVLFHPDERRALARIRDFGLVDTFRAHHPDEAGQYSWWDYRTGAFRRNFGLRIDHVLVTQSLAARCTNAWIDRDARELERASDHAPVCVDLAT